MILSRKTIFLLGSIMISLALLTRLLYCNYEWAQGELEDAKRIKNIKYPDTARLNDSTLIIINMHHSGK